MTSQQRKLENLRVFNLVMGFFHLAQAVLMLVLSNDFTLPFNTNYLNFDLATRSVAPVAEQVGDLRIAPFVASFLFLSSAAHFLLTLPGIYEWYRDNLKKGINRARWYEYSLSSSIMIVAIAMLSGVYDLPSLIMLFSLNAIMNLMGLMMEIHNQTTEKTDWTSYFVGVFAGIIPWIVIAMYFFGALQGFEDAIPKFVYGILGSIFVFFNIFALNMVLQYKKIGPWKDYLFGEKVYIILSLVAKSALAWQIWGGTMRPEEST